ncbi:MAG: SxtJ family membrane protein [Candidatus Rokuibacteriota bacterium]
MTRANDTRQLRNFGLLVGGVFGGIGAWPMVVRHDDPRLWALIVAVGLILPALTTPRSLAPVYRVWMKGADALGWVNTRLLLGLVFYGLVTPMGIVMRVWGRDPMGRRFERGAESYRVLRQPRPASHMRRQF